MRPCWTAAAAACVIALAAAGGGCSSSGDAASDNGDVTGSDATVQDGVIGDAGADVPGAADAAGDAGDDAPDPGPDGGDARSDADDADDAGGDVAPGTATVVISAPASGAVFADGTIAVTADYATGPDTGAELKLSLRVDGATVDEVALTAPDGAQHSFGGVDLGGEAGADAPAVLTVELRADGAVLVRSAPVLVRVDARLAAIDALEQRSAIPVSLRFEDGYPIVVRADVSVAGAGAYDRAMTYLDEFKALYGLEDPREQLAIARLVPVEAGDPEETVVLTQRHEGLEVYGSDLIVRLDGDRVRGTLARVELDLPEQLPEDRIGHAAAQKLAASSFTSGNVTVYGAPRLVWFNADLLRDPIERDAAPARTVLAWRVAGYVRFDGVEGESWIAAVDAVSGEVLDVLGFEQTEIPVDSDADIDIIDANDNWIGSACGTILDPDYWDYETVCDAGSCDSDAIQDAKDVWTFSHKTHRWYDDNLGRDSWDNGGDELESFVDVAFDNPNAAYSSGGLCYGGTMKYSLGYPTLDVVAHEFTHGVVHHTAELRYKDSSGALNESFADVFGALIDGTDKQAPYGFDCKHNERKNPIKGGRDLCEPESGQANQPDHYSEFLDTDGDKGGVHTNSGIMNVVAAMLARGGLHPHNDEPVTSLGASKVRRLWYDTLRRDLSKSSGLVRMCDALLERARDYAADGDHGFDGEDACSVQNACASTGFGERDTDCDGLIDGFDGDDDNDGRPNGQDNCQLVRNPSQPDMDGDGLGNDCDPDMDGDGVANEDDNCPRDANPLEGPDGAKVQPDDDGDGVGDACDDDDHDQVPFSEDNCPAIRNRDQADQDGDGIGDVCDPDRDGDGFANEVDNCPRHYQPSQADSDNDGVGLACDNCPGLPNADQKDTDRDGDGDLCDSDDDGDGVPDDADNCPLAFNPDQFDTDDNGKGYACDGGEKAAHWEVRKLGLAKAAELAELGAMGLGVPLPLCLEACPDHFDPALSFDVTVESGMPLEATIVDSFGNSVARPTVVTSGAVALTYTSFITLRPDQAATWTAASPHSLTPQAYFLRLSPAIDTMGGGPVAFELTVTEVPGL